MPLILSPERALIFRITHRDNVPWILDNGLHPLSSGTSDPQFRVIGNSDLIQKREQRAVPIAPRGVLSDYVPFYFTPYSIMLLNIVTGYNVAKVPAEEIVFLVTSLPHLMSLNARFVFTDQHAFPAMAEYFSNMQDLDRIDWSILQHRDFKHDPEDPGKKERYQAEALIWRYVPAPGIQAICCYSEAVAEQVREEVSGRRLAMTVAVRREWYFG